jgi:hypothetical protein
MAIWQKPVYMRSATQATDRQQKTTLRLPASLLERAKIRAIKEQKALQEIAAAGLEMYLKMPITRTGDGQ